MPGLSEVELETIRKTQLASIASYLDKQDWTDVMVLTVANIPGADTPRLSPEALVARAYPRFRELVAKHAEAQIDDVWVLEYGKSTHRLHLNVLWRSSCRLDPNHLKQSWQAITGAHSWHSPFDPSKGARYWIKEMGIHARVVEFGGSAIIQSPAQERPSRKRRSDYNRERPRVRYRTQAGAFASQLDI